MNIISMDRPFQLFSVEESGPMALEVPAPVDNLHDMFHNLPPGVYTVLRTFKHNKFLHLADHMERLTNSLSRLGLDYDLDRLVLRAALHRVCSDYPGYDSRVRIDILSQPSVQLGTQSRLLVGLAPFSPPPEEIYHRGVKVGIARQLSRRQPSVKNAEFVRRRQPFLEDAPGFHELLMVDSSGRLLEGTSSNFYAVLDGVIHTAGEGVLEGIARKIILQLIDDLAVPVDLVGVNEVEIPDLEEAAISSTSRGLIPVVAIDAKMVCDGRPGPITAKLITAYRAYVASNIKTAI